MDQSTLSRRAFVGAAASATLSRSSAANDRINIGMIGVGGRGNDDIGEIIRSKDLNVTIGGICDVFRPNRERAADRVEKAFGSKPRTTTDFREMLSWKDLDAVVIATPDFGHATILKAAVEAGKDVYVEKPFAVEFNDAKAAYLAVKKSKSVVQVGTQRRSDGYCMAAANLIRSGAIGKVTRVEIAYAVQSPRWKRSAADLARATPADVDWKMFQLGKIDKPFDARLLREWQLFPETTNGIAGLWMSHFVDLAAWFIDDPYPSGAIANGGVFLWKDGRKTSDCFYAVLDYPKEFLFTFSMFLTNASGLRNVWYGTLGTPDLDKQIYSGEGSSDPKKVQGVIPIKPEVTNSHMHNFIECIRSRQECRANVQAGFSHAVGGIMAAESLNKGRKMRFDPKKLEII
jgi:predicted dehydrogenase